MGIEADVEDLQDRVRRIESRFDSLIEALKGLGGPELQEAQSRVASLEQQMEKERQSWREQNATLVELARIFRITKITREALTSAARRNRAKEP